MRIAVISDIHGNMDAFSEVIKDLETVNVERVVSLGDNVGYGAEPEFVLNRLRDLHIDSILGNHELAIVHGRYLNLFNPVARRSVEQTMAWLSESSMDYLRSLKPSLCINDLRFVHGFPPDSATTYLFQVEEDDLCRTLERKDDRICCLGHTHELEIISWDGRRLHRDTPGRSPLTMSRDARHIINIGSVGQPRDASRDAKYAILDTEADTLEIRHVPYDRAAAAEKISAAGLPETHARRLL